MLFVGTETGVYVSIDDGAEWRRLNLNMPPLPVHDIEIKGNDVVVATHGAGFWILDDIARCASTRKRWRLDRAPVRAIGSLPLRLQLVDGLRRRAAIR